MENDQEIIEGVIALLFFTSLVLLLVDTGLFVIDFFLGLIG